MIIDDDELNNYICSKILNYTGFANQVKEFTDPRKALAHLENLIRENPDELPEVILLDLNMQIMDGWKFLEAFEKLDKTYTNNIYISILTNSVFEADRSKAMAIPLVNNYLIKPLTAEELELIRSNFEVFA